MQRVALALLHFALVEPGAGCGPRVLVGFHLGVVVGRQLRTAAVGLPGSLRIRSRRVGRLRGVADFSRFAAGAAAGCAEGSVVPSVGSIANYPCIYVYMRISLVPDERLIIIYQHQLLCQILHQLQNRAAIRLAFHLHALARRAPTKNHGIARHKMIEGGWWKAYTKNGRYIGIIEGDEFIVGKTRILYRISKNKLYSTEVPPSLIADISEKQAITTNGEILLKFSKTTRERRL